jgi:hypothetical protein
MFIGMAIFFSIIFIQPSLKRWQGFSITWHNVAMDLKSNVGNISA